MGKITNRGSGIKSCFLHWLLFIAVTAACLFTSTIADAQNTPLIRCGRTTPCTIQDFFSTLQRVLRFLMTFGFSIAVLLIAIGGLMMLLSGVNQRWYAAGRAMIAAALIGYILILGSTLIIDLIVSFFGVLGA